MKKCAEPLAPRPSVRRTDCQASAGSSASFLHLPQRAPVAFVRRAGWCRRRSVHSLEAPRLDFLGGGRRRQILVELPGFRLCDVTFGHGADEDPLLAAERPADFQFVAGSHQPVWFRGLSVDVHFPALAGRLRFRARPEQTGDVEPHIQTDPAPLIARCHRASTCEPGTERPAAARPGRPARATASSISGAARDISCGL